VNAVQLNRDLIVVGATGPKRQTNFTVRAEFIHLDLDFDSTRIQVDALGHTPICLSHFEITTSN